MIGSLTQQVLCAGLAVTIAGGLAGCKPADSGKVQGYIEGEFVYVAPVLSGVLNAVHVQRGAQVQTGDLLFTQDEEPEKSVREESERRLAQAQATLEDVKKGKRPTEVEAIQAQLAQASAGLVYSEQELVRFERLRSTGAVTLDDLDRTRSRRDTDQARLAQLQAELKTSQLGARMDQVDAAEAEVTARRAALAQAEWNLARKKQESPQAGLVFDTLYRSGEWVAAGRPVVALLPPGNVKLRAFVSEPRIATIQLGDKVRVFADGAGEPAVGTVNFVSPQAEFTPPVIYSRESRSKLVFMIEATFEPAVGGKLHPGQPVDVEFAP